MAVESTNLISGLVTTNPSSTDPVYQGPAHFALLKTVLKHVFPGAGGVGFAKPITATEDEINRLTGVTSNVQTQIDAIMGKVYPVGSIYINADSTTNPATLLGFGTWAKFGGGKVMVGQLDSDPLFGTKGNTGGSADAIVVSHTHTATVASANAPHTHGGATGAGGDAHTHTGVTDSGGGSHTHTGSADNGGTHAHEYQFRSTAENISEGTGTTYGGLWRQLLSIFTDVGGAHSHSLSIDSASTAHTHTFTTGNAGASHTHAITSDNAAHNHTATVASAGASGTNANLQPYIVVHMWRRTA